MSRNFKSIEFFGLPGSGKTYCASIVRQIFEKKGYKVFNARECVINGSANLIKLNLSEKLSLNYFRLLNYKKKLNDSKKIKNKNIKIEINKNYKTNYFKLEYIEVCKKIIHTRKKFNKIIKEIEIIFKDKTISNQQYLFWIYELISSQIIFEKHYKYKNKNLLLLDEGLIQRSFTINKKISKKNKNFFYKLYFKTMPLSETIFFISKPQKKIKKVNKERKKYRMLKYKKKDELKNFFKFLNLHLIKQRKFKFKEIKNSNKIRSKLKKIFS